MRVLIRFDCFGVIGMTMIFTSSRFDDPLIYRACCFLQMLFVLRSLTAASLRLLLRGVAKSYPIRIVIQFSRCNEKAFHLFPLESAELSGAFEKIFLFCKRPIHSFGQRVPKCTPIFEIFREKFLFGEKTSSLIWNWKAETHPVFQKKGKKICPPILAGINKRK